MYLGSIVCTIVWICLSIKTQGEHIQSIVKSGAISVCLSYRKQAGLQKNDSSKVRKPN